MKQRIEHLQHQISLDLKKKKKVLSTFSTFMGVELIRTDDEDYSF